MANIFTKAKDTVQDYINVRVRMLQLGIIEKASAAGSFLIYIVILLFAALATIVFLGMGLGEYFTHLVDSRILGIFMVAGAMLLLLILMAVLRKAILRTFQNMVVGIMSAIEENDKD